jgi:GTP cyclohydrolase I
VKRNLTHPNFREIEIAVSTLLAASGDDVTREGLRDTPQRFGRAWLDYTAGYDQDPSEVLKTFEDGSELYDEIVLVKDIPVYSHCEHHLAPFFGVAHVGYIPNGKVLGLSKFARLVDIFARRLQVQERMTQQIANALNNALHPRAVGVVIECRHLCMEMRGVRSIGATTTTSCLLGAFKDEDSARAEFMRLVR